MTVELTAPEPEDSVEVVPPEGPVPPLRDSQLLLSSNRRLESSYLSGREVHSLDLETGEVVNLSSALTALPLFRRLNARLPGAPTTSRAGQRGAGPVAGRDEGGLHLDPGPRTSRSTSWTPTAETR